MGKKMRLHLTFNDYDYLGHVVYFIIWSHVQRHPEKLTIT